jgi:Abortive infection C-terminus
VISKKTIHELVEHLSGFVIREIDAECAAVDMTRDDSYNPNVPGARRTRAWQYMHALDFKQARDVKRFLALAENLLTATPTSQFAKTFPTWLRRDGFAYENGHIVSTSNVTALSNVRSIATKFDAVHMLEQVKRMNEAVDSDPGLAIGSSKELIETCCKTILGERGHTLSGSENMNDLLKKTRAELKLVPEAVDPSRKGHDTIKRVLSNLGQVAQGINELRGLYGTGHGKDGRTRGIQPRHARLAVYSAAALVTFLFETHEALGPDG